MKKRGFTFIELLVVIGIIGVLAAILFPVFARARESARRATCASNLEQVCVALHMYAQNYDGNFPKKNNEFGPLVNCAGGYGSPDVFFCPSDAAEHYWEIKQKTIRTPGSDPDTGREIDVAIKTYSSYVYKGGLRNDDRSDLIIAGESRLFHEELVNVLYIGGQVKSVSADGYKPVVIPTQKPLTKESDPMPAPSMGAPPCTPAPSSKGHG